MSCVSTSAESVNFSNFAMIYLARVNSATLMYDPCLGFGLEMRGLSLKLVILICFKNLIVIN